MSRAQFFMSGVEFFAVRGPTKDVVLFTRGRISQDQYERAMKLARSLFKEMDKAVCVGRLQ